jgi:hypothetical protein
MSQFIDRVVLLSLAQDSDAASALAQSWLLFPRGTGFQPMGLTSWKPVPGVSTCAWDDDPASPP